jgi:hypothetical protein
MADLSYQSGNRSVLSSSTNWSAVWAGLFTFISIWSVFGILGFVIFTSMGNPNSAQPLSGTRLGLGIWSIILTTVAMYVAGRQTGKLAGRASQREGLVHGMIMFGLSVTTAIVLTAAIVLTICASNSFTGAIGPTAVGGSVRTPYILSVFTGSSWMAFVALFLGWLAAMIGASFRRQRKSVLPSSVKEMRPAA